MRSKNIAGIKTSFEVSEAWIRLNTGPALAYAKSLVRNHHTAEDIVQDCICRLIGKSESYDLAVDGRKLLFRSITNASINFTTRLRLVTGLDQEDEQNWVDRIQDVREDCPESLAVGKELEKKIEEGIQLLSVEQRIAIQMKIVGSSTGEIATMLRITENHAGVLLHRARQILARHLELLEKEQIV